MTQTRRLKGTTYLKKANLWRATLLHDGTHYNLGRYETEREAHQAYLKKKTELIAANPVKVNVQIQSKLTKEIRNALSTTPWRNFPV
jgi:hypothetical protein